jgi:hypothetical protein
MLSQESDLQSVQQQLVQAKSRADTELQHNVFQNRTQFIKISKEAEKLKGEMRMLRNLMSELTGALGQTTMAGSESGLDSLPTPSRNRSHRSSVANLEALWSSHLQALWKRVEGSQKYLPATAGRHVVYESGRWVELNSATWKPRRRVHIILLNDHLLIATEKKRAEPTRDTKDRQPPAQLSTVKCWPLQDVQLADLTTRMAPGTGDVVSSSKAINIRVGSESFTYATASQEVGEKLSLISNFRKAMEDHRRKQDTETQQQRAGPGESSSINSINSISSSAGAGAGNAYLDPSSLVAKSDMVIEVDNKQQTLRWVETQMDDLDIDIALQRFEEAVDRLELLRRALPGMRSNSTLQATYAGRLDERASRLAAVIIKYLGDSHSWLPATKRNMDWLSRLGFIDRAREAYLDARSQVIQKRIRQVIFDGDLHLYIYQISFIYFTIIKHTAHIFSVCFPTAMMSACVKWAKGHVDEFNQLLQRQLSSVDSESATYKECMERAMLHANMLEEVGLDFKDLIGRSAS